MRICIRGDSHLADTLRAAARMRGFEMVVLGGDLMLCAQDILDHADLSDALAWFNHTLDFESRAKRPVVMVSQVPPGTTRKWAGDQAARVFYQVDTIIMKRALARAYCPEQFIVGCADPEQPLPLAYQEYLAAHDCPVLQMSYESAEVAKCAINYVLAKQVEAANELVTACGAVGADYADVERALRNDARIGPHAYLHPGRTNQHLQRDVDTISKLLAGVYSSSWQEAVDG